MSVNAYIIPNTDLIEYTTAERLAAVYKDSVARIAEAIDMLEQNSEILKKEFDNTSGFGVHVHYEYQSSSKERVLRGMKLHAWTAILEKIGIFKVMSSKRAKELRDALTSTSQDQFPDIEPESIIDVVKGYTASATEFLEEAVHEEYDFWKPHMACPKFQYKCNDSFKLNRKIIRTWIVERGYGGRFRCKYGNEQHVTALDNIFHMLANKGPITGYRGPLADTINACDGVGETEFFKFRCYNNGNLHLEFRRQDLLDMFNKIAGRNRLPGSH